MPVSISTEHWIRPDALKINLNHFGDPDYLQVSLLAGAVVMAFKQDVISYNAAHNYRTWPLQAANTYLETSSAYHVYARLTRSEVNASALVVYDPVLRDIEGREITYAADEETGEQVEVLGEPSDNYFYIFLGKLSSSLNELGQNILREWESPYRAGTLDSSEQKNDLALIIEKMFVPHFNNPLDPTELTWIEAKASMGIAGGVTSFINNGKFDFPSIYDGLPIDFQTIYWEEVQTEVGTDENGEPIYDTIKVLKAKGGGSGEGGSGGSVDLSELDKRYLGIGETAEAAKKLATARKIWGQSFDGTKNITGELDLGLSGRIRKPSAYETYDNIRIEMLERINNIPPRLAIQASDYNGVSPQGFISIGGIAEDGEENKLQHLFLFALTTSVFGKLKVVADNASIGTSAKGVTFQVNESGVLSVDAKNGFEIDSLIYDKSNNQLKFGGDLLLNEGLITYDKKKGYFTLNGDLRVTGGVTSYASTGRVQSWMITAETYDEITSSSDTDVYTAKTTSMIKEKVDEVAAENEDAAKKLAAIKSALSDITESSSLSAIASALVTIKNSL